MNIALSLSLGSSHPIGGNVGEMLIALLSSAGGVCSQHDFSNATVPAGVWTSVDQTGNANNFIQATAGRQPTISAAGAGFDGNNDRIEATIAGQALTVIMSVTKDGASTTGTLVGTTESSASALYLSGSGSPLPGGTIVDVSGTSITSQGDLYTALHMTGKVAVSVVPPSSLSVQLLIGRTTGSLLGTVRKAVVLDQVALGGNLTDAQALAETWVLL